MRVVPSSEKPAHLKSSSHLFFFSEALLRLFRKIANLTTLNPLEHIAIAQLNMAALHRANECFFPRACSKVKSVCPGTWKPPATQSSRHSVVEAGRLASTQEPVYSYNRQRRLWEWATSNLIFLRFDSPAHPGITTRVP